MTTSDLIETSIAVRFVRVLRSAAAYLGPARHFSGRLSALGADVQLPAERGCDEVVVARMADSGFGRGVFSVLVRVQASARHSRAAAACDGFHAQMRHLAIRDRIRLASTILLTAAVAHVALTGPAALGRSALAWVAAAIALAGIVAGAGSIEAAWLDWSGRRLRTDLDEAM